MSETDVRDANGQERRVDELLADIRWNCEHCTARLDFEHRRRVAMVAQGGAVGGNPCRSCRMHKYGYGGQT